MGRAYTPAPGGTADRAIKWLRTLPVGAWATSPQVAEAANLRKTDVSAILASAVKGGWVARKVKDQMVKRSPVLWSLTEMGRNPPPPEPPKEKAPRVKAEKSGFKSYNLRLNADVPARDAKLNRMRHPAARVAEGEAITPPGLEVQYGRNWTHDPRVQCAPGEQPFGAGFSAVGIGRSVETGRPWA